jgi:hypothetical protein
MAVPEYIHLPPGHPPPEIGRGPFRAVVVIEAPVVTEWRALVSDWLAESGCLYMMAWGADCSLWDDSVDFANLDAFEYGDIPDDRFIMTSWHEKEPLADVFWFCEHAAQHPTVDLERTVLVHIAMTGRQAELLADYRNAT